MTEMGRKMERSVEKSTFAVTCSLLSQYIKEKGGLGDLGLGMAATRAAAAKGQPEAYRPPTTMSLLPGLDVSDVAETKDDVSERNITKSMDLFPQRAGFGPSDDSREAADVRMPEKAQMTIFYDGKVLVFDDFPAEKAMDLMQLASKGSPATQNFAFVPPPPPAAAPATAAAAHQNCSPLGSSNFPPASANPTHVVQQCRAQIQRPPQPSASYLPIARKASLHRFLEKRKDRINSMAPYETNASSTVKLEERQPWLGLCQKSSD